MQGWKKIKIEPEELKYLIFFNLSEKSRFYNRYLDCER